MKNSIRIRLAIFFILFQSSFLLYSTQIWADSCGPGENVKDEGLMTTILNEEKSIVQEGVVCYTNNDFECANLKWETAQSLIERHPANKYYSRLNHFFDAISDIKKGRYAEAKALLAYCYKLCPSDERTALFQKMLVRPEISFQSSSPFYVASKSKFFISIDFSRTVPTWVDTWEIKISSADNIVVKTLKGEDCPPKIVVWVVKRARKQKNELLPGKYSAILSVRSILGETMDSAPLLLELLPAEAIR